jgi:hypothetical protein
MPQIIVRRDVCFMNLDEIVADAERLVSSSSTTTVGKWPLTQLLTHLALTFNNSIDGFAVKAPLIIRLIGPLIKGKVLRAPKMKPGIKLPKDAEVHAYPQAESAQAALESLRKAIARTKTERMEARHPAFGKLSHEEWTTLHLRHSELHLSFAVPGQ